MKKICLLVGWLCSAFSYGQMQQEGFEGKTFPPENWTIYHLMNRQEYNFNGWQRQQHQDAPEEIGKFSAYSLTGRYQVNADSWLVTPVVNVRKGDHLNFVLKAARAGKETESTFEILVSETGKDKENFVHQLAVVKPRMDTEWTTYSIDLSQFAGKEIYVAFHDYLLNPSTMFSGCDLFLDNVEVSEKGSACLAVSSINSPYSDCSTIQFVDMTVANTGDVVNQYTVCYQVGEGAVVKQQISEPLAFGQQKKVCFEEPVEFKENTDNTIKAWVEVEGVSRRDTLTKVVHIGRQIDYPYALSKSQSPKEDFKSYHATRGKWQYQQTALSPDEHFVYVGKSMGGYLASNCIALPKGKVKVAISYISSQHALMHAYAASSAGLDKFTQKVGESELLLGNGQENKAEFIVDIPESGLQSLGFILVSPSEEDFVNTAAGVNGVQFILTDLRIEEVVEDLVLNEIVAPVYANRPFSKEKTDLTVSLSNRGLTEQTNFTLNYQLNKDNVVTEAFTGKLAAGEKLNYTFKTPLDFGRKENHELKVWVDSDVDQLPENNAVQQRYNLYEAYKMPYAMNVEDDVESAYWTVKNENRDMVEWQISQEGSFKGNQSFVLPIIKNIKNEDCLVSPAIQLPKGKARIAFFYRMASAGATKMQVWMGKDMDQLDSLLYETAAPVTDWENISVVTDVEEAGDYYFGIRGEGTGGIIQVDDIRIDDEVDACVKSLEFLERANYNLTTSAVQMVIANYGTKDIVNPKVAYQVGNQEEVVETVGQTLAVGDTLLYVFENKADISKPGILRLKGRVEASGDVEENNNTLFASKQHFANLSLPYFQDFEEEEARVKWTATALDQNADGKSWVAAGNAQSSAYSGKSALYYDSRNAGQDWVFSECIALPAGDIEMSFFYRTNKNYADRKENFKVMLGKEQTPEAMTIEIADFKETSVYDPQQYMKVIRRFTMDEPGNYFIGIFTDSPVSKGCIYIDDILIKPYEVKEPFYSSDFKHHFDDWTAYQRGAYFDQWLKVSEEGRTDDIVQLKTSKSWNPGLFVSPGFKLEKGKTVRLDLDYALITPNEKDTLVLYMGNENHPDSLTTRVAALPSTEDWTAYTKDITVEENGRYFFAVQAQRAGRDRNVLYKLGSFKLTPAYVDSYELSGKVIDAAGCPLTDVSVNLQGGQSQTGLTDESGVFSFKQVLDQQKYTLEISKDNFITQSLPITLNGKAENLGELVLKMETYAPDELKVAVDDSADVVKLDWTAPLSDIDFRHDDGRVFGNVGFNKGNAKNVMGTVHRVSAVVNEISWYTVNAGAPHNQVNLYLLDLDEEGNPTGQILYAQDNVTNVDDQWNVFTLPAPVSAPRGFMVAVSYNKGSLNLGVDDGEEDYPFCENGNYIGDLSTGIFDTMESKNGKSNFMVRAKGFRLKQSAVNTLVLRPSELAYNVYRVKAEEMEKEDEWLLLNEQPLQVTHYEDEVTALSGDYVYAVKTVYPTGETSVALCSDTVTLTTATGIAGNKADVQLQMWPLPVRNNLNVKSSSLVHRYTLCHANGVMVNQQTVHRNRFQIPVVAYAPGTYVLRLETAAGIVVKKIVID